MSNSEIEINPDLLNKVSLNNMSIAENLKPISLETIIFSFIFMLIFLFGLFTNSIVLVVYFFNQRLKKCTNCFFANLSISDVLVLVVCLPITIFDLYSPNIWRFGYFYCIILSFKLII
jgi:hypothetical protein